MVHLSKTHIPKEKLNRLYELLYYLVNRTHNKTEFLAIINEILSPSEQIMVSKRVAILYLLSKAVIASDIADCIKVSRATVAKFFLLFNGKESATITMINRLIKNEKIKFFIEDFFADLFIQPGIKKGHWNMYMKNKQKQRNRKLIGE